MDMSKVYIVSRSVEIDGYVIELATLRVYRCFEKAAKFVATVTGVTIDKIRSEFKLGEYTLTTERSYGTGRFEVYHIEESVLE